MIKKISSGVYDAALNQFICNSMDGFIKISHPILKNIGKYPNEKNPGYVMPTKKNGEILDIPHTNIKIEGSFTHHNKDGIDNIDSFLSMLYNEAQKTSTQLIKYTYDLLSKTAEFHGNVIDGEGKSLEDSIYAMMMKMDIDEENQSNYTFHCNTEMVKRLMDQEDAIKRGMERAFLDKKRIKDANQKKDITRLSE